MNYEGELLREVLMKHYFLQDPLRILSFVAECLSALDFLEQLQIVHRNIHPVCCCEVK